MRKIFLLVAVCAIICSCNPGSGTNPTPDLPATPPDIPATILVPAVLRQPDNSGLSRLTAFNMDGSVRWQRDSVISTSTRHQVAADGVLYSSVAVFYFVGGGPAYISYNNLHAIDLATGQDKWSIKQSADYIYSPAIKKDTLFCSIANNNNFYVGAYNANNGTQLFKTRINFPYAALNLAVEGNTLYFITSSSSTVSNVIAFDIPSKTIKWNTAIGINLANAFSKLVIGSNSIILKNGTGLLMALDKTNGSTKWSKPGVNHQQPVLSSGKILSVDEDHGLYAYDEFTGSELWHWNAGHWTATGNPYVAGDNVFIGGSQTNNYLQSFNKNTGTSQWRIDFRDICQYPLAVGDYLFVLKDKSANFWYPNSKIVVYNSNTGVARDSVTIQGENFAEPMIIGQSGKIYSVNYSR